MNTGGQAAPTGVAVRLEGLSRSFGEVLALEELTLDIGPGELVALLGPSGCGKTTALRVLAGLEDADGGAVLVGGRDISEVPANKRGMGMVFQAYSLFPHMTAAENVAFGLTMRGVSGVERRARAAQMLQLVGLNSEAERYAHQLSGGQQQRVALARALAIRPQVLLLDEPLSALDAQVRTQLRDEIRRIHLEVGTTTLFVTHDQEEALSLADRVGVMRNGHLEQVAAPEEVYARPATAFVAEFVGLTNRVTGQAKDGYAHALGEHIPLLPGSSTSGDVIVLVRPETVRLDMAEGSGTATVIASSFLGSVGRVQVRCADGTVLLAQVQSGAVERLTPGTPVDVHLSDQPALAVQSD